MKGGFGRIGLGRGSSGLHWCARRKAWSERAILGGVKRKSDQQGQQAVEDKSRPHHNRVCEDMKGVGIRQFARLEAQMPHEWMV